MTNDDALWDGAVGVFENNQVISCSKNHEVKKHYLNRKIQENNHQSLLLQEPSLDYSEPPNQQEEDLDPIPLPPGVQV